MSRQLGGGSSPLFGTIFQGFTGGLIFNVKFLDCYNTVTTFYPSFVLKISQFAKSFFSGFCKGSAHGYLYFIKGNYSKKFHKNTIPKIINNFNGKKEYWLFYNLNAKINDDQIIILNKKNDINLEKYNIIHQYKNQCFFVEKKND